MEALYFAFGDTDVFAVADFPDKVSAAAVSLAPDAAGVVKAVHDWRLQRRANYA